MKLGIKPVERSPHILNFPIAVIVFTLAESSSAKIEPQHGISKAVQRLHRVKHDLVMQRPPKQGVGMADYCCMRGILGARVQQRLDPACRTFKKERPDR